MVLDRASQSVPSSGEAELNLMTTDTAEKDGMVQGEQNSSSNAFRLVYS